MEQQPHFSMIRGFHLADWFTIANAFCGMGAVLAVMAFLNGELPDGLLVAAALVPAAFVFDAFDGRVARWRQKQSALGRELDSLADVISFGVAPAALGFGAGLDGWTLHPLVLLYLLSGSLMGKAPNPPGTQGPAGGTDRHSSLLRHPLLTVCRRHTSISRGDAL